MRHFPRLQKIPTRWPASRARRIALNIAKLPELLSVLKRSISPNLRVALRWLRFVSNLPQCRLKNLLGLVVTTPELGPGPFAMAEPGFFRTGQGLSAAMMIYTPKNMELVREALTYIDSNASRVRISDNVLLEGVPLPGLPEVRTVGDLRKIAKWPENLRLIVNSYGLMGSPTLRVRVEQRWNA